jgi:hypothetical protein
MAERNVEMKKINIVFNNIKIFLLLFNVDKYGRIDIIGLCGRIRKK